MRAGETRPDAESGARRRRAVSEVGGTTRILVNHGPDIQGRCESNPPGDHQRDGPRRHRPEGAPGTRALHIAEAHYYQQAWIMAIYADDTPVGFVIAQRREPARRPRDRGLFSETAIHRLSEQGQQRVLHIAAGAAFMDIIVGCLCEPQSGIKLAACQESRVRGDGSATKIQADSAVVLALQRGVGAFTHWVPPARLRYPELDPLARPVQHPHCP